MDFLNIYLNSYGGLDLDPRRLKFLFFWGGAYGKITIYFKYEALLYCLIHQLIWSIMLVEQTYFKRA